MPAPSAQGAFGVPKVPARSRIRLTGSGGGASTGVDFTNLQTNTGSAFSVYYLGSSNPSTYIEINEPGLYAATLFIRSNADDFFYITLNSAAQATNLYDDQVLAACEVNATSRYNNCTGHRRLVKGDRLRVQWTNSGSVSGNVWIEVTQLSVG